MITPLKRRSTEQNDEIRDARILTESNPIAHIVSYNMMANHMANLKSPTKPHHQHQIVANINRSQHQCSHDVI